MINRIKQSRDDEISKAKEFLKRSFWTRQQRNDEHLKLNGNAHTTSWGCEIYATSKDPIEKGSVTKSEELTLS